MNPIEISAKAKINLFLHILDSKEYENYHSLESLVSFVDIQDNIVLTTHDKNETKVFINKDATKYISQEHIHNSENNIISKVLEYFTQNFNTPYLLATLDKKIPIGAGLGGGSSNAGNLILALNHYFDLNLSYTELIKIASLFGSDVPCFISNKACFMFGRGEKITKLQKQQPLSFDIVVVYPNLSISTKKIFNEFDEKLSIPHFSQNWLSMNYSREEFLNMLTYFTKNNLTNVALPLYPQLKNLIQSMDKTSPIFTRMTGSGSTFFSIYHSQAEAENAFNILKQKHPNFAIFTGKTYIG